MRRSEPPGPALATRTRIWPDHLMFFAVLLVLATGCISRGTTPRPSGSRSATAVTLTSCGTAKTAAGVTVHVEIAKGHVPCATALSIEQSYAAAVRSGRAPGNGGGGPVKIQGWTCQGFTTPVVDQTGYTSKCVRDGDEILEILLPQ
jgi:hypothetical protein